MQRYAAEFQRTRSLGSERLEQLSNSVKKRIHTRQLIEMRNDRSRHFIDGLFCNTLVRDQYVDNRYLPALLIDPAKSSRAEAHRAIERHSELQPASLSVGSQGTWMQRYAAEFQRTRSLGSERLEQLSNSVKKRIHTRQLIEMRNDRSRHFIDGLFCNTLVRDQYVDNRYCRLSSSTREKLPGRGSPCDKRHF